MWRKQSGWRCNCIWAFLSKCDAQFLSSFFSPFRRENFLVRHGRKHLSYRIFILPNQTHFKKVFILIFFPKFSIHLISPSNKHTLKQCYRILFYFKKQLVYIEKLSRDYRYWRHLPLAECLVKCLQFCWQLSLQSA